MRPLSLKKSLTVALLAFGAVSLVAAAALVGITTRLHRAASSMSAAIESVRLAQQLQIELLVFGRAGDPIVRSQLERALGRTLEATRSFVSSPSEQRILDEAARRLEALSARHAAGGGQERALQEALRAIGALVDVNVRDAREMEAEAARWDRLSNLLGYGIAIALLAGIGAFALWFRRAALQPIVSLDGAIARFASGDAAARAPELGSAELRAIAARFNAMADALARKRHDQLAFLAGVAHDLRNPLSAMALSLARLGGTEVPAERVRRSLDVVRRQLDRMNRMVSDFLDASQLEAGALALRMERVDLRRMVEEIVELYAPTSAAHELRLAAPDAVPALCDPTRIHQVVSNLVGNAIKYSPRGGAVEVTLGQQPSGEIVLSVRDEGLGISKEDQAALFEPFRRVGVSAKRAPGIGLGLYVSRRIVDAHGGRIEVESDVGRGATFRVLLPPGTFPQPRAIAIAEAQARSPYPN